MKRERYVYYKIQRNANRKQIVASAERKASWNSRRRKKPTTTTTTTTTTANRMEINRHAPPRERSGELNRADHERALSAPITRRFAQGWCYGYFADCIWMKRSGMRGESTLSVWQVNRCFNRCVYLCNGWNGGRKQNGNGDGHNKSIRIKRYALFVRNRWYALAENMGMPPPDISAVA